MLCFLLAFTFIPKNAVKFTVSADTTVQTGYEYFSQSYFRHLTNNFGRNYHGSCAFVAMAMLLSYYDTYHDDDIVLSLHDVESENASSSNINNMLIRNNSPGTLNDSMDKLSDEITNNHPAIKDMKASHYRQLLMDIQFQSLHAFLILLAEQQGMINLSSSSEKADCGISTSQLVTLFNTYLQGTTFFEDDEYEIQTEYNLINWKWGSDYRRNKVISYLQRGIPVLVTMATEGDILGENAAQGHAMIAYDYDEDDDIIYCHSGWHDEVNPKVHITPESEGLIYYTGYIVLEWNTPHNCSNNYIVKTQDANGNEITNTYCYEHKDIITYDHVCSNSIHEYEKERYDYSQSNHSLYHKLVCHCGNFVSNQAHTLNANGYCNDCSQHVNHNYSYTYLNKYNHNVDCFVCLYTVVEAHSLNSNGYCIGCLEHINHNWSYSYLNNNLHSRSCTICVYAETSPHVFDASNLTYCILCEHIVLGGGIGGIGGIFSIELAPLVSANGSYVLSNGCVVLVEEDKEAFFNDTLQFYPRGQVPQIS